MSFANEKQEVLVNRENGRGEEGQRRGRKKNSGENIYKEKADAQVEREGERGKRRKSCSVDIK